jgi:hypothetical protein
MTQAKKLKKRIRARARKTGESYTAARRQVLAARATRGIASAAPPREATRTAPRAKPDGAAKLAGREARVMEKTGHGWSRWFSTLDAFDTRAKGHTAAARHLAEDHGVPGWYAQMITVEYERARGLRAQNQRGTGDYEVSVSKALPASVGVAARALADGRQRGQWLPAGGALIRASLEGALAGSKTVRVREQGDARFHYRTDGPTVDIVILPKPDGRSTFVTSTTKLASPEDVERHRTAWRAALESLKQHLAKS